LLEEPYYQTLQLNLWHTCRQAEGFAAQALASDNSLESSFILSGKEILDRILYPAVFEST